MQARSSRQMRLFAIVLRRGDFHGARIDLPFPQRMPLPRADIRQYRIGVGAYNGKSGLMVCCPVTNQSKGYPFEVPVVAAPGSTVTGVVLSDQVKSLDWRARNAAVLGSVTKQCVDDVATRIKQLVG